MMTEDKQDWIPWEGGERPKPDSVGLIVYEPTEANKVFRPDKFTSVIAVYFDEEGRICDYGTSKPEVGVSSGYWRATHWMPFPERPLPLTEPYTIATALSQIASCGFECEAGPLENEDAWRWLVARLTKRIPRAPGDNWTTEIDRQHMASALLEQLGQEGGLWVAVRQQGSGWELVRPRTQEALLAACETESQP